MAETDVELGLKIHEVLIRHNAETPFTPVPVDGYLFDGFGVGSLTILEEIQRNAIGTLGIDLKDDSLRGTPKRIAKMWRDEIFSGMTYMNFPACTTFENKANYDEMLWTTCTVQSMCEHHFLPFIGTATIAYIPGAKFMGLSKFNRVVDFFSRRPQVQERLTQQLSLAFQTILETPDVAVIIKAEHYCVKLRGVKDDCGETGSSCLTGKFRNVPELRAELIGLVK